MSVILSKGPSYSGNSPHTNYFLPCCPLNYCRKAARGLCKIGRLFSLFLFYLSLARIFILLFLLMSSNVHPNPGSIFPCLVYAGNVTWRGKSVQCCTCFKWARLRCSLLFFSRFKALESFHSRSCPPCCIPVSFGGTTLTNIVYSSLGSSSLYTFTVQPNPSGPSLPMQRSRITLVFKLPTLLPLTSYPLPLIFLAVILYFLLPLRSLTC